MTKEQVVKTLNGMVCEIAQVQIRFYWNGDYRCSNILVYLVDEPSNNDQIINSEHWYIFSDIAEFIDEIKNKTNNTLEFISVDEFISDFDD